MLRAVIESEHKKAYFDFCGTWDQLEKAVRQVITIDYIRSVKMESDNVHVRVTKCSKDVFEKVKMLITSDDSIFNIYFVCKKLQYDDIGFKDRFLNEYDSFQNIEDVRKYFVEYSHERYNEKISIVPFTNRQNPNNLTYELLKLFGNRVLYTEWRIDKSQLPTGIYAYEVREDGGLICSVEKTVFVNFYGTMLTDRPIKFNNGEYLDIDENKDIQYSEEPEVTLKQYMNESKLINYQRKCR